MESYFDELKAEKIKEAAELFEKLNIIPNDVEKNKYSDLPIYNESSDADKEDTKLFWTRLSINSNVGYIIE